MGSVLYALIQLRTHELTLSFGIGHERPGGRPRKEDAGDLRVRAGPVGPLVREVERFVVVHRHDQVLIVIGQPQLGKLADAVPASGADEDRPAAGRPGGSAGSPRRRSG